MRAYACAALLRVPAPTRACQDRPARRPRPSLRNDRTPEHSGILTWSLEILVLPLSRRYLDVPYDSSSHLSRDLSTPREIPRRTELPPLSHSRKLHSRVETSGGGGVGRTGQSWASTSRSSKLHTRRGAPSINRRVRTKVKKGGEWGGKER